MEEEARPARGEVTLEFDGAALRRIGDLSGVPAGTPESREIIGDVLRLAREAAARANNEGPGGMR